MTPFQQNVQEALKQQHAAAYDEQYGGTQSYLVNDVTCKLYQDSIVDMFAYMLSHIDKRTFKQIFAHRQSDEAIYEGVFDYFGIKTPWRFQGCDLGKNPRLNGRHHKNLYEYCIANSYYHRFHDITYNFWGASITIVSELVYKWQYVDQPVKERLKPYLQVVRHLQNNMKSSEPVAQHTATIELC